MYFRVFSVFNLILILVAASLSWTPAMVMAKFALFTRIALQVIMPPTLNPESYKWIAYKKVSYHFNLPSGPVSPGPFCVGVMAQQCEVWFLDRSLFWHYLSPSFTAYYRLMITHLGLRSGSIISLRMAPAHKLRSALSIQIYLNRRFE